MGEGDASVDGDPQKLKWIAAAAYDYEHPATMAADREKERKVELENAMYTNYLLLSLDPTVLSSLSSPVTCVSLFRHFNLCLGQTFCITARLLSGTTLNSL